MVRWNAVYIVHKHNSPLNEQEVCQWITQEKNGWTSENNFTCKAYPNLILAGLKTDGTMQCIVNDMTAFRLRGVCYELTLYMDLWNNEILGHSYENQVFFACQFFHITEDLLQKVNLE